MSWKNISISDLGRVVTGDTPPRKNPEYYGDAYPFIKPTDMIVGQRFTENYEEGYSQEGFEKYERKLVPKGSTAVVTIGSIGQKMTLTHTDCFVNQAVNAVIPDSTRFDSLFVYYLLKHNLHLVKQADTGASSGRENVSKSNFSALRIDAPEDLHIQKQIAKVLSGYDDLIEANQRRIQLLEESARLLFREWFVKLRFPGHETVPVIDGVPKGWGRSSVIRLCSFLNRGIAPQYNDAAKGLVINQKCVRNGRLSMGQARRQSKEVKPERLVQQGDILINSTGAGTLGRVAIVMKSIPSCTVDTHITIARPEETIEQAFFGLALLNLEPVFSEMGKGATNQLELSRGDIGNVDILLPTDDIQKDFHRLTWPLLVQAQQLTDANELLQIARDILLPKLMSGALDVSRIVVPKDNAIENLG